jgi:hypothetical protein
MELERRDPRGMRPLEPRLGVGAAEIDRQRDRKLTAQVRPAEAGRHRYGRRVTRPIGAGNRPL